MSMENDDPLTRYAQLCPGVKVECSYILQQLALGTMEKELQWFFFFFLDSHYLWGTSSRLTHSHLMFHVAEGTNTVLHLSVSLFTSSPDQLAVVVVAQELCPQQLCADRDAAVRDLTTMTALGVSRLPLWRTKGRRSPRSCGVATSGLKVNCI